jgi:hypothetical protein
VLGPEEEDGRNNIVESLIIFYSYYNSVRMIKARESDRRNMQTNGDDGGAKGISFGKPLENSQQ